MNPWLSSLLFASSPTSLAADIPVADAAELESAFADAMPGDVIVLADGDYVLDGALWTGHDGTESAPITVTTSAVGAARIDVNGVEGIVVAHPWWVLEHVWLNGACVPIESCDAGLHVKPTAHHLVVRGSRFTNFRQHIKGSRDGDNEVEDVLVLGNELYNDVLLEGGSTTIDIVGGKRWRVAGNYIHDYGGDANGDYGIFLKGVTSDGVVERNLVICANDIAPAGATVGISFGGGGTGDQYCPGMDCSCEDFRSIARNNIVLHCTDAGLHTKRACGSRFYNNTVYDTGAGLQIQIDGAGDPVDVRANVFRHHLTGAANVVESNNLFDVPDATFAMAHANPDGADFSAGADPSAFADLAPALAEVTDDYCGAPRGDGTPDFGAVEFPGCVTWPWSPPTDPSGGEGGSDDTGADGTADGTAEGGDDADDAGADSTGTATSDATTSAGEPGSSGGDGGSSGAGFDDGEAAGCSCRASSRRDGWQAGLGLLVVAARARRRRSANA